MGWNVCVCVMKRVGVVDRDFMDAGVFTGVL
jgi:hypothetical protein